MRNLGQMLRRTGLFLLLVCPAATFLAAQVRAPQQEPPSRQQPLSPQQLDTLVAPVALYPDSLVSQVLVAATYPLEIVEANQWLQQNGDLQSSQLVDAARQQNWDASIQALVMFPDVLGRLASDVRWTTDLGNAFLARQADVMRAVQRMRIRAQQTGRLNSNDRESVTYESQGGDEAVDIEPANPEVVYVPQYNPEDVWGAPEYGDYPDVDYSDDGGFGFYPGVYIGGFFGGLGFGGWGWAPNWFACNVFQRPFFFQHFGFGGGGNHGGIWSHDPGHRMGVPYPNRTLANRFGAASMSGSRAGNGGWQRFGQQGAASFHGAGGTRASSGSQWQHFNGANSNQGYRSSAGRGYSPSASYSRSNGYRPSYSYRGANGSGYGGGRSASVNHYSPSYGGGGYHSAGPSFHGGGGGGGGSHGGGGGGFHGGGGGSRGGGRR